MPKEPLSIEDEESVEERLRTNAITITLTPQLLEDAGIDDPETLSARGARHYYNELLPALLEHHSELLNTGVFQYRLGERPGQGAMSTTYYVRRANALPREIERALIREEGPDDQFAVDEHGKVTQHGESDLVLRSQWLPRRGDYHRRAIAFRELAVLESQGKLRSAQLIKFSGSPAFRDVELALVTMTRARGEALTSLLPDRFMPNERVRPELSIKDMYALMQATRAWVQQLKDMDDRKVQHRDIKPEHLFINFDDPTNSDIIDWGLAKSTKSERTATPTGAVVGSLQFLSPRAIRDIPDPDRDVYALGVSVGTALRLFFWKTQSPYVLSHAVARGEAYDVPKLDRDSYHQQLQSWSPYLPERQFAYILSRMITQHDQPGSFCGNFNELLAMIDEVLVNQRLWVEADDALGYMELQQRNGLTEDVLQRVRVQMNGLKNEMHHGTEESMRKALADYRLLITTIQQSDPRTTAA